MKRLILNHSNKECSPLDGRDIAQELKLRINNLKGDFYDLKTGGIDYLGLKDSEAFEDYKATTGLLCSFALESLRTREAKLAFWINIYNSLVVHGIAELNIKNSVKEVSPFFRIVSYEIGGFVFSLDDIEHGILRGNKKRHFLVRRPFSNRDPRREFILGKVDPRIHFALVCGSKSCPPIGVYEEEEIDQQLDLVSAGFINSDEIIIDKENRKLKVSKIFKWYKDDFGSKKNLLEFFIKYLNDPDDRTSLEKHADTIRISYNNYDWSLNFV